MQRMNVRWDDVLKSVRPHALYTIFWQHRSSHFPRIA